MSHLTLDLLVLGGLRLIVEPQRSSKSSKDGSTRAGDRKNAAKSATNNPYPLKNGAKSGAKSDTTSARGTAERAKVVCHRLIPVLLKQTANDWDKATHIHYRNRHPEGGGGDKGGQKGGRDEDLDIL